MNYKKVLLFSLLVALSSNICSLHTYASDSNVIKINDSNRDEVKSILGVEDELYELPRLKPENETEKIEISLNYRYYLEKEEENTKRVEVPNTRGLFQRFSDIEDLTKQKEMLINMIAKSLGMEPREVRLIASLGDERVVYSDKQPNIFIDSTVKEAGEPYKFTNNPVDYVEATFIKSAIPEIERQTGYYLPDALYTTCKNIQDLMETRYKYDRLGEQQYFDDMKDDTKERIVLYEAILAYTGAPDEAVNSVYRVYEKLMYDKNKNENIVTVTSDGEFIIKPKFMNTLRENGFESDSLAVFARILSYDGELAENDNIDILKDSYTYPYVQNYTSRENMIIAANCLVGKVRYVWGGGHSGASFIDGINPVWEQFNSLYPTDPEKEGYNQCVRSSRAWCPFHGNLTGKSCYNYNMDIHSLDDYINQRSEFFNNSDLKSEKYRELMSCIDYTSGISGHSIDGLDCSGYVAWVYNQITDKFYINSTAKQFTQQSAFEVVPFGSDLLPGDIFAWTTHIVMIVGRVDEGSKAYVTLEQTPNVVRYGVVYYAGASQADIQKGLQIAREANSLIGGLSPELEKPKLYCMNNVGKYTSYEDDGEAYETPATAEGVVEGAEEENGEASSGSEETTAVENQASEAHENTNENVESEENTEDSTDGGENTVSGNGILVQKQYMEIGRFTEEFKDENVKVHNGKTLKEMNAQEIIQHTLEKLPYSYVTGYNDYNGKIFDKTVVGSNLG